VATVKIGLAYRAPSVVPERFGKWDMVIPYSIDGVGPWEVRVPEEDYSASKGEEAVRRAAQAQVALKDKELQV